MTIAVIDTESFFCVHCRKRRLLAIAYVIYDINLGCTSNVELLYVQPFTGCIIDTVSLGVHGITHADAHLLGRPLESVLYRFTEDIKVTNTVAAHDVHADAKVLIDEAIAMNNTQLLEVFVRNSLVCTKLLTTRMLRLRMPDSVNASGWKWPSLKESFAFVTGGRSYDEHNPVADVMACVCVLQAIGC